MSELRLTLPDELLEAIARRAAELVLEQLDARDDLGHLGDWLTPNEAAAILRCGPQRIYEMRTDGRLSRFKEGGRALVSRREVEELVKRA